MINILKTNINKFTHVLQVADCHVRLNKRHDEYKQVFNRLYEAIKKTPETTAIALVGDVFHSKSDLSPECVQVASDLFKNISDLRPLIMVAGNHDCYSEDHSVLTKHGWVNIAEYVNNRHSEEVATFNEKTKEIEFQTPINLIKNPFDGELCRIIGKKIDLLVTPTHQVLHTWTQTKKYYKKEAQYITPRHLIPLNGIIRNKTNLPYYKLLGFSFAEGTFVLRTHVINTDKNKYDGCRVQFHLKKPREINYLSIILEELNYKFNVRPQKDGSYFVVIYSNLAKQICDFFSGIKEIPTSILSCNSNEMRNFIDGYLHGDGCLRENNYWECCSISKESIDRLFTIARMAGCGSTKSDGIIFGNYDNSKQQYKCYFNLNDKVNNSSISSISNIKYSGFVYCLTVPNSTLMVRRNDKISICGNCTLSNKSRLDSLSPIVNALNHPNLYYLKTTGLYGLGNILWNNMCVFDSPEKYILGKDIPSIYRNEYEHIIALFHGAVDRASLDTGYAISNPSILPPLFDYNDIALLGDIHKRQDMQDYDPDKWKPCIHYVGSMIQQNHGEGTDGHGYSLWDLKTRTYKFTELPNEYGYFTVEIHNGKLTTDISTLPKFVRLRVKFYDSVATDVKQVVADIKMKSQVVETAYLRMDQEQDKRDVISLCKDIVLSDLTSVDYQAKLLTEFLSKKLEINSPQKIDEILKINKETNALIKRDDFSRNLKWKPIRFEWDNMFTYGEGNVLDFTKMDGVYGIFGPNASGKSAILSSMIFCLFDKFDRGYKGLHVLNVQRQTFRCKFEFEISGVRYFIEREGTTTRTGNVKVDVAFWKIVNGVKEELHGNARRNTNDIIRDYIGTYEDFIITAASFQTAKNLTSFIDMGNSERKDLLVQYIGLNVFDRLHESAGERNKELSTILKIHKDKNYQLEIQQNESALAHANSLFEAAAEEAESLKKQIADVNEQIIHETSNLIKLDTSVPTDLTLLESRKKTSEETLITKRKVISDAREVLSVQEKILAEINNKIDEIEKSNFVEAHKTYKKLTDDVTVLKQKIDLKKVEIKGKLEKVARLDKHEYDPNCKFCINNAFVKDATKAKKELVEDKVEATGMMETLSNLRKDLDDVKWVENTYEPYTKLLTDRGTAKDKCATASKNIIIATNELERLDTSAKAVIQQIEIYHRNAVAVEQNSKVQAKINAFRSTLTKLDVVYQKQYQSLVDISGKREMFKSTIANVTKTLAEVTAMEAELGNYQLYLQSVGRDGIPYQVICNTVPEIEKEVNSILSQVVDYTIQFETDGKNIMPYIVYQDKGRWPLELASGFERFVSSIAIRVGLSEVSNLPKFSGLFLDEGMGTLDSEHLVMMSTLFSVLKNYFDFVIVISHLDSIRDAVDKTIEISRVDGFAKVVHE